MSTSALTTSAGDNNRGYGPCPFTDCASLSPLLIFIVFTNLTLENIMYIKSTFKTLVVPVVVFAVVITSFVAWSRHDQIYMTPNMIPDDYICVYSQSSDHYACGDEDYMTGYDFFTGR